MDLSQLGASGAVVIVVILFLRFMKDEATKRDITYSQVAKALNQLTKATDNNSKATTSADTYLKQRNGRDIEKHEELLRATQAIPKTLEHIADAQAKAIIEGVALRSQHVKVQHVEKEIIHNKETA